LSEDVDEDGWVMKQQGKSVPRHMSRMPVDRTWR